ncbi:MAG: SurA N-terminal domain-containing protein [Candidatus Saccharibacteria bacterium]|nr:SurA N-terminal domain-containing protein [Candidatus Saccharibacteria bacterium]
MKISEKIKLKKEKKATSSGAITQQNIEESREEIIAKGKKFKYPFQYAKHRLIISAILIGLVAIGAFTFVGWVQLYKAQNTGEVMYRFTRTLGLSVAEVDGVKVRFSDYLMLYRSSIASVERQQGKFDNSDTSKQQLAYYKRQALTAAEDYAFAMAKLEEAGKSVTEKEIDEVIEEHKIIDGEKRSDEAFEGIIKDNFGLSINEYRRLIMLSLAKKKASVEFDKDAKALIEEIAAALAENSNMEELVKKYQDNDAIGYEVVDSVEFLNLDSGRAAMASTLENVGDISNYFVSKNGDGYYIVKLTGKTETKVSYASIWVRFKWLDSEMAKLREDGKVTEKIDLNVDEEISTEEDTEAEKEETENSGE